MASKKNKPATTPAPVTFQRPEGFEKVSTDVVGFWVPEAGPIYFIPTEAIVSDSKLEPLKQSGLIRGRLLETCTLINADDEQITGQPGQLVGVWAKPGMKELRELAGCRVFMFADGEKDTGKQNPMMMFDISTARGATGGTLPVEDRRKQSLAHGTWLAPAITRPNVERNNAPADRA